MDVTGIITTVGTLFAKWLLGGALGFALCMVIVWFNAWRTGHYAKPDPIGVVVFVSIGVVVSLIFL